MILVIDVGNTNMTLGVYDGQELRATFRMMTKQPRTSDEYGVFITQLLKNKGIEALELEGSIVASVVPDVMRWSNTRIPDRSMSAPAQRPESVL